MIHYADFEAPAPKHEIQFLSKNKQPTQPPNPEYPNGLVLMDPTWQEGDKLCRVELPYPAPCIGAWRVKCNECGRNVACTTAGRADDPKLLHIRCANQPATPINGHPDT